MNESNEPDHPEGETPTSPADTDQPVTPIPQSAMPFCPRVGEPLDLHVDLSVGVLLGRSDSFHRKFRSVGIGLIGSVSETSDNPLLSLAGMPVNLDLMSPHVMLVAGKRGSGKSYTLGIIAEELALAMERSEIEVAAVLVDTVDVFRQMVEPNSDQVDLLDKWNLQARGFPVNVYIPRRTFVGLPDEVRRKAQLSPLSIGPRELTVSDWGYVLEKGGSLSTAMENLIGDVIESVRSGYALASGESVRPRRDFSIKDMIHCIEQNASIEELYKPATRMALIQRLKRADRLGVFHPGGTSAQDLAVAGQITVIDVAPLGSDAESVLAILTNMLCRQVLTYRMAWTDEGTSAREELPPTWLIIDEAHTLVPKSGVTPAKDAIVGYAKLGRRFGCSLVLCTQQPSAVSDDAISQADIVLSHSLSHDNDIRALQQRAPAVMPDQFRDKVFISSLPRGVALVFDQTTENKRGFLVQIRPRLSKHGGTDRLSGLFEAVKMLVPDETEEVHPEDADDAEIEEPELEEEEELPEVPRPPIKLSKEDWRTLDDWMKKYIETLFEQKRQEFSITEETSPREVPPELEVASTDTSGLEHVVISSLDPSQVGIRIFEGVSSSLLAKATLRKVLYSRTSHEFLFRSESDTRDQIVIEREGGSSTEFVNLVAAGLSKAGLHLDRLIHEDGFTFVCFRRDGLRVAFAVGKSGEALCAPVVAVGANRQVVTRVIDTARTSLSPSE
ncbi:MAG: ATP-binding protein [Candidatus Thorarchaeota archaeon]